MSYFSENRDRILDELFEWLRIPTISALPEYRSDMLQGADWIAGHLDHIGLENVQILATSSEDSPPIVYADWLNAGADAPTVLMYGHYDVQPPDPLEQWETAPFDPTIRDGKIFARGANDNKGQHFILLKAIESILKQNEQLPNIKFFLEGEEEIGGVHLATFIKNNTELLGADICVISDTPMLSPTQPSIITGLRGLVYMQIDVTVTDTDMHSGHYGGNVHNPAQVLAWIVSKLKDESGVVLVPGFYDDVKEWSLEERSKINEVDMTPEEIQENTGAKVLFGESDYSPIERFGIRPTLDVNGIWGGFSGVGAKTVIPATAGAKVSMRMVAHQNPEKIEQAFRAYVESLIPDGVEVTITTLSKDKAIIIDPTSDYFQHAVDALTDVFGVEPKYVMEGGSIPVGGHIKEDLGIDTIYMGFGLVDDQLHAPNEKFNIEMIDKGIESARTLLQKLAS